MTVAIRPLVAGNWKMNGCLASLAHVEKLKAALAGAPRLACDVVICPPAPYLLSVAAVADGSPIIVGAQDCHARTAGPHTGDVSAAMLQDVGCRAVILGHCERRAEHCESDGLVAHKAVAAHHAGLLAIICIGETQGARDRGETIDVLGRQLEGSLPPGATADNTVVAYEPIWAIGTGRTPTLGEVADTHGFIRAELVRRFGAAGAAMRILYGGSVKPANAGELMAVANVNGALVGGASLAHAEFWGIVDVYAKA